MNTLRSQPTPDGTQLSEPEILSQVLGTRSRYVRGLGHGAKLMTPARATSSRSIVIGDSVVRRTDIAEREVQQLRVVIHDIREELDRQKEEQERKMMEELDRKREEQERKMEEMRVEHERWITEMFHALTACLPTDARPPPPSSL
ncbi:uncharacterized protein LOC131241473 [Magnolia sinica]|uniref:uncharacterized protein LOC131241473 n=1 Tax=Magnolia sinica TaxID=86752 RepID=UPI00265A7658|nr:uncharacterized protein LOC131241473 [Magnolia sinica]